MFFKCFVIQTLHVKAFQIAYSAIMLFNLYTSTGLIELRESLRVIEI